MSNLQGLPKLPKLSLPKPIKERPLSIRRLLVEKVASKMKKLKGI